MHSNVKLQVAAIFCVCNLVWKEEPGAAQRQARLRELGLYRILQQLRHTKDSQLFDKYVKLFLNHKNNSFNFEKYIHSNIICNLFQSKNSACAVL